MRLIMTLMMFLTVSLPLHGEELWACDGLKNSKHDASTGPFLMRGNANFYKWRGEYKDFELKKVGERRGISGRYDFDIYVDVGKDTQQSAFYIQKDGNKLEMRQFLWLDFLFYTNCVRQ